MLYLLCLLHIIAQGTPPFMFYLSYGTLSCPSAPIQSVLSFIPY